jgi:CRISPR-associated endonuclease/helicase Cas3
VWQEVQTVNLPFSIRPFLEASYSERQEDGSFAKWLRDLKEGGSRRIGEDGMKRLADISLAKGAKTLPEKKAQTRYSDLDSEDLLLVRSCRFSKERKVTTLVLLGGEVVEVPRSAVSLSKHDWRKVSAHLMKQIVKVPDKETIGTNDQTYLRKIGLGNCLYLGCKDLDESLLQVALVSEAGEIASLKGDSRNAKYYYERDMGLRRIER